MLLAMTCARYGASFALSFGAIACSSDPAAVDRAKQPPADATIIESPSDSGLDATGGADSSSVDGGTGGTTFDGPTKLSETELYADILTGTLASGIRSYDVRYPLWADGATKKRYLYLPPGQTIDTSYMDVWNFPIGTKAWKEFAQAGKIVETRMLWKRAEGLDGWVKVAYLWNQDGSDAIAVPQGMKDALGTTHDVPSIDDCEQCHNGVGDVLIGVSAIQLSKENGGGYLSTLITDGVLSDPPAGEFPVPGDGVVEDTIGYVHGNCGQCHNNESFLAQKKSLRLKLLTSASTPEETGLYTTAIKHPTTHILGGTSVVVAPGDPDKSQLYYRTGIRDLDQMPPLATELVDTAAHATIKDWILSLPP